MASERETVQKFIVEVLVVCRQLNVKCIWCYAKFDLGCPDNVKDIIKLLTQICKELRVIAVSEN